MYDCMHRELIASDDHSRSVTITFRRDPALGLREAVWRRQRRQAMNAALLVRAPSRCGRVPRGLPGCCAGGLPGELLATLSRRLVIEGVARERVLFCEMF